MIFFLRDCFYWRTLYNYIFTRINLSMHTILRTQLKTTNALKSVLHLLGQATGKLKPLVVDLYSGHQDLKRSLVSRSWLIYTGLCVCLLAFDDCYGAISWCPGPGYLLASTAWVRNMEPTTFSSSTRRTVTNTGIPRKQFPRSIIADTRGCYEDATGKLLPWNLSLTTFSVRPTSSSTERRSSHEGSCCTLNLVSTIILFIASSFEIHKLKIFPKKILGIPTLENEVICITLILWTHEVVSTTVSIHNPLLAVWKPTH